MRMTIRIGNLDLSTKESDLEQLCSPFGQVRKIRLVANIQHANGLVGIVELRSEQECRSAMAGLRGQDYRGRALTVSRSIRRKGIETHPGTCGGASVTRAQ